MEIPSIQQKNRTPAKPQPEDLAPETYPWGEILEKADALSADEVPAARAKAVVNEVAVRRSLQRDDARSVVGEAHYIGLIEVTGQIAYLPATDEQNQSYRSVTTDT